MKNYKPTRSVKRRLVSNLQQLIGKVQGDVNQNIVPQWRLEREVIKKAEKVAEQLAELLAE